MIHKWPRVEGGLSNIPLTQTQVLANLRKGKKLENINNESCFSSIWKHKKHDSLLLRSNFMHKQHMYFKILAGLQCKTRQGEVYNGWSCLFSFSSTSFKLRNSRIREGKGDATWWKDLESSLATLVLIKPLL